MKTMSMRGTALLTTAAILAFAALGMAGCASSTSKDAGNSGSTSAIATATVTPDASVTPTTTATQIALKVYLVHGEKLGVVTRSVPATAGVAAAAMRELVAGPSASESAKGFQSELPAGTGLRSVSIKDDIATVDLTSEYETGGGSLSMQMRLAQVVYTLTQFSSVTGVDFKLNGTPVTVFSGEGLSLDTPQTRADYADLLSDASGE